MAVGGSTNAVVHLLAIAGRTPHKLVLDDFDTISRRTPFLVNVRPSGQHMMEDFFFAGGVPAVMRELLPLLHRRLPDGERQDDRGQRRAKRRATTAT